MKRVILILILSQIYIAQFSQIIADHTVVDKYDDIPVEYITEVKQMYFTIAGESHAYAYRIGLQLLEALDARFDVNYLTDAPPETYTTSHLRTNRVMYGDIDNSSSWAYSYGEEDWYSSATAIARTKNGIAYCNSNGYKMDVLGFGFCWDPAITDMTAYLNATQEYIDYCATNGYTNKIIFTTGPADLGYSLAEGYAAHLNWESIRAYVEARPSAILFDYADILCYNSGSETPDTRTYDGHVYPCITTTNGSPEETGHISNAGAIRLGKAVWWMLARIAGWDGGNTTIWNGTNSNIWNDPENWTGGLPTNTSNIVIPEGLPDYPVGSETQDFVIGAGNVMIIEPAAQVTLNKLTNNGTLWLKSDASGIASLKIGSYIDNGTEKIELYLTGGADLNSENYKWHYISSPVKYLSTNIFTAGEFPTWDLAAYYENYTVDSEDLIWFAYDGWDYQNEVDTDNEFDSLDVGQGYNYYYESTVTRIIEGTLKTASVTKVLSYSGTSDEDIKKGWNLLGNPFSATLNWDLISKPTGVDNAVYFTSNNTFASYVAGIGIPDGTGGKIPPMQGFFVKANTNTPIQSITLPASAREHSLQSRYKGEGEIIPHIRLKIESQKISDETVIRFDDKAYNTFDSEFDAYKFSKTGTYVSIWTITDPVSYSINSIPFPDAEVEIPVGINIEEPGSYKLSATKLQGLNNYQVCLMDKVTGMTINLRTTPTIDFTAPGGMVTDRFVIKVINTPTGVENPIYTENKFSIYSSNDLINIQTRSEEWDGKTGSIKVLDLTGKTVIMLNNIEFWKNLTVQVSAPVGTGIYIVEINSENLRFVEKLIKK